MKLKQAISTLTSGDPEHFPLERAFAFAAFSAWLNAPNETLASESMCLAALMRVLQDPRQFPSISHISWASKVFEPKTYLDALSGAWPNLTLFWFDEDTRRYGETHYASDIVRFLLSFRDKGEDKRDAASLGKAYEFLNKHGGFVRGNYGINKKYYAGNHTKHQRVWKYFKTSAAFQFVRYHDSQLDFLMDPHDPSLIEKLCIQAARREELLEYFSKVHWVQDRLKEVLDHRSMAPQEYIKLPNSIEPKKCAVPRMPLSAYDKMASYTRYSPLASIDDE